MIRAPDTYVYAAPFNIVETFFIAPLELVRHLPPTLLVDKSLRRLFLDLSTYAKVRSLGGSTLMSNMGHHSSTAS